MTVCNVNEKDGFTLLEMVIVLAIIGTIMGFIVGGKSIIEASERSSIISDVNNFKAGIKAFKIKYRALPGDLRNASDYWPADCTDDAFSKCNGNFDGIINTDLATDYEGFRAWNHLSLAGMIKGSYTGTKDGGKATISVNMPGSKIEIGGYMMGSLDVYGRTEGNHIQFSSENNNGMDGGILNSKSAQAIDDKLDDGQADAGQVFSVRGKDGGSFESGCVTSANLNAPSTYQLNIALKTCRMFFWFED